MNIFDLIIVQPIFNALLGIYTVIPGSDFGVTIIVFTILIRFLLYPLVKRQLHQVKAMRKLQPELEKIKKRTKGNKQQESLQMMELYKQHGVNPFRSIGILIIQIPVFIALYRVIQIMTSQRKEIATYTYDFLKHIPAIDQLIKHPEQFNEKLFGFVDLTQHALGQHPSVILIILALAAAAMQFIMSRQTMPHAKSKRTLRQILGDAAGGKEADQSEINAIITSKMMYILPFFMFFVMMSLPGALSLYYATSNIVAAIQQHFILKRDEEELEEIADEAPAMPTKKATAKARARVANEATVTRIVAKDSKQGGK